MHKQPTLNYNIIILKYFSIIIKGRFRGWRGGRALPLFCSRLFFNLNQFEELQTVLLEVEMIINNAPLTYIYPNTIETCLTPSH